MPTKHIRGNFTPQEINHLVRYTAKCIRGTVPDHYRVGERFWSAVAHSLFESIFSAFIIKSNHGKDELGISWKDLKPETKAYSRSDARSSLTLYDNRAVNTPSLRVRPTLPPAINKAWGGRWLGILMKYNMETEAGKQIAAGSTWEYFKAKGYPTLIGLTKNMKLPILRKTGALQRSLFPAPTKGGIYIPLDPNQICDIGRGTLTVGTRIPYAEAVAEKRPLWKKRASKLWIDRALDAGRDAVWDYFPKLMIRL